MQFHLYVPDAIADAVRQRAGALGLSTSRYLADLVMRDIGAGWPPGYFENVIGGWQGEALVRADPLAFEDREPL